MICIDPGLRGVGIAQFDQSGLVSAAYIKNPRERGRGYEAHLRLGLEVGYWGPAGEVLIEHPRIYPGSKKPKNIDENDLLDVVAVGAACAVALNPSYVVTVYPSEWKGTVKKSVMLERIRKALSPEELARCEFTNKSDDEDLLDAVGIGLWRLGRLNKKVYPR